MPLNTGMVTFYDAATSAAISVIDPSKCDWGLQDVSANGAGRDEALDMHKMRVGQLRTYALAWKMIDPVNASIILKAVNKTEYFQARLWDSMDGEYQTRWYYVGDRSSQMQQWRSGIDGQLFTQVAFTIIEKAPDNQSSNSEATS